MSDFWNYAADIGNFGLGLIGTGYGIYSNERNYKNMLDQQRYERELQETMFSREDNAVTRRTKDLINAGLSPYLATGGAAPAGQEISRTTPRREQVGMPKISGDVAGTLYDIKIKNEQVNLLKEQVDAVKLDNELKRKNLTKFDEQYQITLTKLNQEISESEERIKKSEIDRNFTSQEMEIKKFDTLKRMREDVERIRSGTPEEGMWLTRAMDWLIERTIKATNPIDIEKIEDIYDELLTRIFNTAKKD